MTKTYERLTAVAVLLMLLAAGMIFLYAPEDYLQKEPQRIFYLHVSAAIAAFACFLAVLVGSVIYLRTENAGADRLARAAALVGVVLVTMACMLFLAAVMVGIRYRIETLLDEAPSGTEATIRGTQREPELAR